MSYTFYVPHPDAERPGPFPVVVFLPGFQYTTSQYTRLLRYSAGHGFLVVAVDPEMPLFNPNHIAMRDDAIAVLEYALTTVEQADPAYVGATGHSLGGKVAAMIAEVEPRLSALMGIDPVNGRGHWGHPPTRPDILPQAVNDLQYPLLFVGQTSDTACAPIDQNFQRFYEAATFTHWRTAIEFVGADHVAFADDEGMGGFFCGNGTADGKRVRAILRMTTVSYFQFTLYGDTRYEDYVLNPEAHDVSPGELIVTHD